MKMRFGAACALLALAIQFSLSFGHAHRREIAPFGAFVQFMHLDHAPLVAMLHAPAVPIIPGGMAFDFCEICAVASLAGSAIPAAPPELFVAVVVHQIRFWLQADAAYAVSPHRLFQARAPPRA
jgi:hypothetical protein